MVQPQTETTSTIDGASVYKNPFRRMSEHNWVTLKSYNLLKLTDACPMNFDTFYFQIINFNKICSGAFVPKLISMTQPQTRKIKLI